MSTRITLTLPPLSQLNTPYPSIAYLARALKDSGRQCHLRDVGLEVMLELFSKPGLTRIFDAIENEDQLPSPAWRTLALREQYEGVIDAVIRFLQGRDRTLATRILDTPFLPQGPRLSTVDLSRFGDLAVDDAARHLCTLFLEDLADLVTSCIDRGFSLACYQHHLATGPVRFEPIEERLSKTNVLDEFLDARTDALIEETKPDVVGISVPFPGMLIGALRMGRRLKKAGITVVLGGGYINTELREVNEPRLWDYVDAITYDDGEGPFLAFLDHLEGQSDLRHRTRTKNGLHEQPVPKRPFVSAAWYGDLRLDRYLQLIDSENPAHRLWSDGRWNKITLAHGCYWKKCAFCDVELDYIARYEPARISQLVDAMEELIETTGQSGFHIVDEAAPPKLMRDMALEILDRSLSVSWWGNIRFERAFSPDMCRLLAASGLIAVTGGLEVASNRLLEVIDKGITVEQAARAAHAFGEAGVLVHAYLMYGFPSQSEQETVDSMEVVRQMFATGVLTSGFWHRFVLTRHSLVFQNPDHYGVKIPPLPEGPLFATNDIPHTDPTGADPERFDRGLVHSIRDWMRGENLERPAHIWFDPPLIPAQEHPRRIENAISSPVDETGDRLVWLGGHVLESPNGLLLHHLDGEVTVGGKSEERECLHEVIEAARPGCDPLYAQDAIDSFPGRWDRYQRRWQKVRAAGMVQV